MEAASISRTSFPPVERTHWLAPAHARASAPPLQPGESEPLSALRKPAGQWALVQRIDDPDAKRAHTQAQEDLAEGASGLALVFEGAPNAYGYGLPARPEALAAALHGIQLANRYLRIDVHPASRASVDWIVEIMRRRRVDPARVTLSFGIDPAAIMMSLGRLRMSLEALRASMPQSLAHFFAMGLPAVLLEADARVAHNAGASEAQELGILLASAVSHLRLFEDARQPLIYAVPHIGFTLSVDQNQHLSLAKLHALRRLWQRAQEACALPASTPRIHAETSFRMLTAADPKANIVRSAMAAFAAAAGGADSISVLPHTMALGLPDREARRLARDTQLILSGETHVGALGNPTLAGEELDMLIAGLCEAAWDEFRQIEAEGGLLESLSQGRVQTRIRAARAQRVERHRENDRLLVGTGRKPAGDETGLLRAERRALPEDGVAICEALEFPRLEELLEEGR